VVTISAVITFCGVITFCSMITRGVALSMIIAMMTRGGDIQRTKKYRANKNSNDRRGYPGVIVNKPGVLGSGGRIGHGVAPE